MTAIVEFRSDLTQELVDELVRVHEEGKDFRNSTAIRCNVHPRRLKNWLLTGSREGQDTLHSQLFLRFAKVEADLRAKNIAEVLNTTVMTEETTFDPETGKPASSVMMKRSTAGTQWYMERRWRQFRNDWTPNEDDQEVCHMLTEQAAGSGLNLEAAFAIVAQLAAAMPPQLAEVFVRAGWTPPRLETATNGEK